MGQNKSSRHRQPVLAGDFTSNRSVSEIAIYRQLRECANNRSCVGTVGPGLNVRVGIPACYEAAVGEYLGSVGDGNCVAVAMEQNVRTSLQAIRKVLPKQ